MIQKIYIILDKEKLIDNNDDICDNDNIDNEIGDNNTAI